MHVESLKTTDATIIIKNIGTVWVEPKKYTEL